MNQLRLGFWLHSELRTICACARLIFLEEFELATRDYVVNDGRKIMKLKSRHVSKNPLLRRLNLS